MAVILITGCSSGFGLLTAARLADAGHSVYATMRNLSRKDDLLSEVKQRGGEVRLLPLDVTDDASINAVVAKIAAEEEKLHVVINNAGYGIGGFFEDLTEAEIRAQMETNFFGVQKVIRRALPLMRKTAAPLGRDSRVKIINISSVQGRSSLPGMSAYAASKFALEGFSESLAHELRPFGIHVVLVEPGGFRTQIFTENALLTDRVHDPDSPYAPYSQRLLDRANQIIKSGRSIGDPEEVAGLLERIVNHPRPRLRYMIGSAARLRFLAQRLLPSRWFAALVQRIAFGEVSKG